MKRFFLYTNGKWLAVLIAISGGAIFYPLIFKSCHLIAEWQTTFSEIAIGVFSAVVLLFVQEIVSFRKDTVELGFLNGTFVRKYITEMNEDGVRTENFKTESERQSIEQDVNIKFLIGTKYHELTYYEWNTKELIINLNYEYAGYYTGTAEYLTPSKDKTIATITLSLNISNKVIGSGSYSYTESEDYGTYNFQITGTSKNEILVYYKNTLPSGLAEGYEIWKKQI